MASWACARRLAAVIVANGGGLDMTQAELMAERAEAARAARIQRKIIDAANSALWSRT